MVAQWLSGAVPQWYRGTVVQLHSGANITDLLCEAKEAVCSAPCLSFSKVSTSHSDMRHADSGDVLKGKTGFGASGAQSS